MGAVGSILGSVLGMAEDNEGQAQSGTMQNPLMTPGGGQVGGSTQPAVTGMTQPMGGQSNTGGAAALTNSIMNMALSNQSMAGAEASAGSMYTNTPDYAGTDPMYNYFWEY